MTAVAAEFGLEPLWAMDLTTYDEEDGQPWDFNDEAVRGKAENRIDRDQPDLIMLGPTRAPISLVEYGRNYQRMNNGKAEDQIADGMRHLAFAVTLAINSYWQADTLSWSTLRLPPAGKLGL